MITKTLGSATLAIAPTVLPGLSKFMDSKQPLVRKPQPLPWASPHNNNQAPLTCYWVTFLVKRGRVSSSKVVWVRLWTRQSFLYTPLPYPSIESRPAVAKALVSGQPLTPTIHPGSPRPPCSLKGKIVPGWGETSSFDMESQESKDRFEGQGHEFGLSTSPLSPWEMSPANPKTEMDWTYVFVFPHL